ncbi:PAS domain-containing protein [Sulfurimonas sp.]|nr:PAS domain-containing protein [Sulfurimonas sp.]
MGKDNNFEFSVDSVNGGSWDYNIVTQSFILSKKWKERLGFQESEELTYFTYLELIPDKNRFEHHQAMHEFLEDHEGGVEHVHFCINYPIVTKNGETLTIKDSGDIFFNEDEIPVKIQGFQTVVTS